MRARKQDREIPDTSGVYQIRCKSNGKIYVGSAVNLRARWDTHRRELRRRLPPLVHKGFIAPGGAVVRITNLSAFCRACDLCLVHMFELKSGRRPRHKGWIWKHDADQAFE